MDTRHLALSILLFSLLLSSISSAACPTAHRQVKLAAVIGEETGGIFTLLVDVKPGNGTIYTSINPLIGVATQESEQMAVSYAFNSTGINQSECDVFFSMFGDFGGNRVDGPSAGAAMALATRSALLGTPFRQDVVVTGTISPDGKVGAVGGIIEKSTAASDSGARYILVPSLQIYESFLLSTLSANGDFSAVEVQNIPAAERVLTSSQSEKFSLNFSPQSKPIPSSLEELKYDSDTGRFSIVASHMVDALESTKDALFLENKNPALEAYFNDELAKYRQLTLLGYPFTAANAAFLLSVDAQYVGLGGRAPDLDVGFETTSTCLSSLPKLEKTRENFHWATGADLRRIWAKNKLNLSSEARPDQSGYLTLRDLYFAYGWCQISDSLGAQAGEIGGTAVDESKLKSLSDRKLSAASKLMGESPAINYDALWHLQNGFDANQSGNFGAAIYEATYAQTMQSITNDESSLNISALAEKAAEGSRTSLWGKIYFAQGKYLYSEAKDGGFLPSDAYTILKYSSELDKAAAEIDSALLSDSQSGALPGANPQATANASSQGDAQQGTGSKKDDALVGGILTLFFIAACAMIAFSFWKKERWNP